MIICNIKSWHSFWKNLRFWHKVRLFGPHEFVPLELPSRGFIDARRELCFPHGHGETNTYKYWYTKYCLRYWLGLHKTGLCNYSNSQSFHVISFAAECAGLYCPNLQLAAHRALAFINYLTQVTFSSPAIILVQSRSVETTALLKPSIADNWVLDWIDLYRIDVDYCVVHPRIHHVFFDGPETTAPDWLPRKRAPPNTRSGAPVVLVYNSN